MLIEPALAAALEATARRRAARFAGIAQVLPVVLPIALHIVVPTALPPCCIDERCDFDAAHRSSSCVYCLVNALLA